MGNTKTSWDKYKRSEWWLARKAKFLETRPKNCPNCGSNESVGVYHKHYNSLNAEKDEDLELLCIKCWLYRNGKIKTPKLDKEYRAIVGRPNQK
jgi:hypothetical protein